MRKVIIFGLHDFAELAHFYLTNDSEYEVVAFTVSKDYLIMDSFKDLPVVPFENIEDLFPPEKYLFFVPMAPVKMNMMRMNVYIQAKAKGYRFINYVSSKATILGSIAGENCFILENNTIQPFTKIGNNVVLWSGNHIGHHSEIMDHVMFTSHVVLSGHCKVEPYCFLGVNSTVRDGVNLKEGTLVGMGACIIKDTEPWSIYLGNPGKKSENKNSKDSM